MLGAQIVAVLVFEPLPGKAVALRAVVVRGMRRARLVPGCQQQSLHEEADGRLTLIEKWASREELRDHVEGELAAELLESYRGLLAAPPVPRLLAPREAYGTGQPTVETT